MRPFVLIFTVCFNFSCGSIIGIMSSSTTKTIEIDSLIKEPEILQSGTDIEITLLDEKNIEGAYVGVSDSSLDITKTETIDSYPSTVSYATTRTVERKRTIPISEIKQIKIPGTQTPFFIGFIIEIALIIALSQIDIFSGHMGGTW